MEDAITQLALAGKPQGGRKTLSDPTLPTLDDYLTQAHQILKHPQDQRFSPMFLLDWLVLLTQEYQKHTHHEPDTKPPTPTPTHKTVQRRKSPKNP